MLVKKKSSHWNKVKYLIFPIIGGGLVYLFLYSSFFAIQKLNIQGGQLSQENADQYLGADIIGSNIFLWKPAVDMSDWKAPIFTWQKNIFLREVNVNVIERRKDLVWCYMKENSCFWIDENGLAYDSAPIVIGNLMTIINDYTDRNSGLNEAVLPDEYFGNVVKIIKVLDSLKFSIAEIRLENLKYRELEVRLNRGPDLVFSLELDPLFTQAAILQFFKSNSWDRIKKIDLTVVNRAYASF